MWLVRFGSCSCFALVVTGHRKGEAAILVFPLCAIETGVNKAVVKAIKIVMDWMNIRVCID